MHKILIIMIIFIILICFIFDNSEHFSNESIQSIASVYNNNMLTVSNANITQKVTVGDSVNISGNCNIGKNIITQNATVEENITIGGNLTFPSNNSKLLMDNLKTDNLGIILGNNPYMTGSEETLSETAPDVIIQNRDYVIVTGNMSGGNITDQNFSSVNDAIRMCKGTSNCDRIAVPQSGQGSPTYLGYTNSNQHLIGSKRWPSDVAFAGYITNHGNGNKQTVSASNFESCHKQCVGSEECDYFQYLTINNTPSTACNLYSKNTNNDGWTYHFIKKF